MSQQITNDSNAQTVNNDSDNTSINGGNTETALTNPVMREVFDHTAITKSDGSNKYGKYEFPLLPSEDEEDDDDDNDEQNRNENQTKTDSSSTTSDALKAAERCEDLDLAPPQLPKIQRRKVKKPRGKGVGPTTATASEGALVL